VSEETNIKQIAVSGVRWNTIATVYCMIVQIVRLSILTRLLEKSDFGLIAIAMMVIAFTDIFSEVGSTIAIIHKQNITKLQYSSVFWFNIILSVVIYAILRFLTPLAAELYHESILNVIIPILGLQILINAFGKMFQTIKTKNLEFKFISLVKIFAATIGFIVTVLLALWGYGIFSLVYGQLLQIFLTQAIYCITGLRSTRISFKIDLRLIKDFIKIGLYRVGSQFFDFLASKIDIFLIGRFWGMDDLGLYNLAKELIIKPFTIIYSVINNVASAAFAKIQENLNLVRKNYCKLLNLISSATIVIYALIFIMAEPIVDIMYSSRYEEVVLLLRILAFYGFECSVSALGGVLQIAYGRTDIGFAWTLVRIAASVVVILVATSFSIYGVAYGQLFLSIISLFLYWLMVIRPIIHLRWQDYMSVFFKNTLIISTVAIPFAIISEVYDSKYILPVVCGLLFLGVCLLYLLRNDKASLQAAFSLIKKK